MNIEISFIIPANNIEQYINKCLEEFHKIRNQKCEFIIVNDGSSDTTPQICKKFVEMDKRFKLIEKSNEGVSKARNDGLKHAKGNWICFWDGDDWISENFGDKIFDLINEKSDIICFGMNKVYDENEIRNVVEYDITECTRTFEKKEIKLIRESILNIDSKEYKRFSGRYINFVSVWGKLFKNSLLQDNHLEFEPNVCWAEDLLFVFKAFRCAEYISTVDVVGYNYRIQSGSAMHSFKEDKRYQMLQSVKSLFCDIKSNDEEELLPECYLFSVNQFLYALKLDICHKDNQKSYSVRKKQFLDLKRENDFKISFQYAHTKEFRPTVRIIVGLCKLNMFFALNMLFAIKNRAEKFKV